MRARRARRLDRRLRARVQDRVLADERAVEVDRERGDRAREAAGEVYGIVPPVDFTTYAATSAIFCVLSVLLNGGMAAPPFVTCAVTAR